MRRKRGIAAALLTFSFAMLCGCGNTDNAENGENVMPKSFSEEIQANETVQANVSEEDTPFSRHGKLSVNGANLVDERGNKYQLYGMSTHGITPFERVYNSF